LLYLHVNIKYSINPGNNSINHRLHKERLGNQIGHSTIICVSLYTDLPVADGCSSSSRSWVYSPYYLTSGVFQSFQSNDGIDCGEFWIDTDIYFDLIFIPGSIRTVDSYLSVALKIYRDSQLETIMT
jgi:hypothetical protein